MDPTWLFVQVWGKVRCNPTPTGAQLESRKRVLHAISDAEQEVGELIGVNVFDR